MTPDDLRLLVAVVLWTWILQSTGITLTVAALISIWARST